MFIRKSLGSAAVDSRGRVETLCYEACVELCIRQPLPQLGLRVWVCAARDAAGRDACGGRAGSGGPEPRRSSALSFFSLGRSDLLVTATTARLSLAPYID